MIFKHGRFVEVAAVSIPTVQGMLPNANIVVVIPAYNEERFIGSVVLKSRRYAATVIVVDDGSVDSTALIAAEAGAIVFSHAENAGKGSALNTAFRLARDYAPDVVVTLDADGQHRPEELVQVIEPVLAGQADMVIGSRYIGGASQVPRHRILGHRAFNLLTNRLSGEKVTDSQSGYRAFSSRALELIYFHSNGFSVESEMQFLAHEHGLRLIEVPITIQYTDKPKRSVLAHGLMVLNGILRLVGQNRPLLFFSAPGLAALILGVSLGFWVVRIYDNTQILAIGYALITVLLSITGTLALFTGIILHSIRGLLLEWLNHSTNSA